MFSKIFKNLPNDSIPVRRPFAAKAIGKHDGHIALQCDAMALISQCLWVW
jgi:hypothetical protein